MGDETKSLDAAFAAYAQKAPADVELMDLLQELALLVRAQQIRIGELERTSVARSRKADTRTLVAAVVTAGLCAHSCTHGSPKSFSDEAIEISDRLLASLKVSR